MAIFFVSMRYLSDATVKNGFIVCKNDKNRFLLLFALRTPYSSIFETDNRFVFYNKSLPCSILVLYHKTSNSFCIYYQWTNITFCGQKAISRSDAFAEIPKINSQTKPGPVNAPFRYFLDVWTRLFTHRRAI